MKKKALLAVILIGSIFLFFFQKNGKASRKIQPQVVAVFPSSDTIAANLLRLYIHFSNPMKPIGNLEKIQLKNENGDEIVGAIFNNVHELWNHEQTQLTLLLDPSRVKTGLGSHEERGRALISGKSYQLTIGALQDVEGRRTVPFTRIFMVNEEDLMPPNTDLWTFDLPKAGNQGPLIVRFPKMLDRLSLIQRLKLVNEENIPLTGRIEIANNESAWLFHPDQSWIPGHYTLYVHSRLEDPSGNNLNGLFDHQAGNLKNEREGLIKSINLEILR
ncbi:MAG: hypothetical protein AAF433_17170 [Bacteroidota bacterium]